MTEEELLLASIFAEDFKLDSFEISNKGFDFKSKDLNKETYNRKRCILDLKKKSFLILGTTTNHFGIIRDNNFSAIHDLIKYEPIINAFNSLKDCLLKTKAQNFSDVKCLLKNYNLNFKNSVWDDYIKTPILFNFASLYTFLKENSLTINISNSLYLTDINNNKFFIKNTGEIFNIDQLKYFDIECQRDLRHLYYYIFQYLRSTTDMIFLQSIFAIYDVKFNII